MKKVTWQRIGAAALAVLVWQAASMAVGSALLLPSPAAVLVRLAALLPDGGFWRAVWFSFCRIAGGFGAALVLGTALAFAAGLIDRNEPVSAKELSGEFSWEKLKGDSIYLTM